MLKVLFFLAACYALFVVIVFLTQARLIFLPNLPGRALTNTPEDLDLEYEDVQIQTTDGVALHGWFVPGASERVLLFFHGNAGNISHRLASIQQFHELDLSVFIIDYRGYGQSEGRATEHGTYRDADAAWRYLTDSRGLSPNQIVVFGRSLGGPIAAWLATQQRPGALIVESAFSSLLDIGQEVYPFLPIRWLSRFRYPTRDYVGQANCPVLVVHSREDEIIPFHHGERIFAAAPPAKQLLEIFGPHNGAHLVHAGPYIDGLRAFLARTNATMALIETW